MEYTDQLQRTIILDKAPARIVSLVPSQTELLYSLGLDERVVGITKFCVHPDSWFRTKVRVGGTKKVNFDVIRELQPDLIIANKEENTREDVAALMADYPVWVSDVHHLKNALEMIAGLGAITQTSARAAALIAEIRSDFSALKPLVTPVPTAYFIWREPYMTAGGDTFIHQMMQHCGLHNVFGNLTRYPAVTPDDIRNSGCRLILLSSEPYPFKDKHLTEFREMVPDADVQLVNGEMFSWYGSRLREATAYFSGLMAGLRKAY
ncbi:helical backbone metal receptor [Chitinophaga sp. Cy-1792]|uniref:helical backbone metal receptor n=1 Tax=Chitinophaga sp. Cy-1792 TaxID=2608339 RepID=UPI0014200DD2|nr:helical backbone metal receptor [Chitinophaga sp. Cy-1792]NIG56346.1 ABC transporter substrate-binding protein [Chitinophaga sp. Cy-1792]